MASLRYRSGGWDLRYRERSGKERTERFRGGSTRRPPPSALERKGAVEAQLIRGTYVSRDLREPSRPARFTAVEVDDRDPARAALDGADAQRSGPGPVRLIRPARPTHRAKPAQGGPSSPGPARAARSKMGEPKEASEISTRQSETRPGNAPREATSWLSRAWLGVALVPVFFFLGFAVGEAAYAVLGYQPENADAPLWVDLVTGVVATAVCLVPCVAAVLYGWRANLVGDRTGLIPLAIGAIAGLSITVLTIVSTLGAF